jgi:cysteine-rich repeat protein
VDEACDDNNLIDGDGCDTLCELEMPICADFDFSITPTTGEAVL